MDALEHLAALIDATWFGEGLSPLSRTHLAAAAREYRAPAGTRLLREGDETRELSLLIHGRVALSEHVPGRGSVTLMTVEPGDIFGWTALVSPFLATSTVMATDAVHILAFDGAKLRAAIRADVELAAGVYEQVLEAVSRRLLATRQQLLDLYRSDTVDPW